ncbi:histidine kinase dimerization/phosphoacceptor domain -containing protein (plasmid) [Pseudomonas sp. HR96]|uniref:sensor histidine kinase n=1 Tax=Pseudomonas sp. HR96 TaxID=1027966 RepID=UPI002A757EE4|nr:histidine kinase dimerization/phosphoacceptor domain -containing protein [Pseudomonas sp. HR96]WPP02401.1 histidine kinase dimerization/phosphoacceptor domain -containing protein [Pseudomonas sp. HR96]
MSVTSPEDTVRAALQISHARLRKQHEIVVDFGVKSLRMPDLDGLLTQACQAAASGMNSRFAKLLRLVPEQDHFLLAYGVGWDAGDIGTALVGADDASPAGYAFKTDRPVISNHLGQEHRFRTPSLLEKYGIKRAINVPVRGMSAPYGVLEVDSQDGEDFIESDLVFLEGLANVISMAVERVAVNREKTETNRYSESVLNASPDCVKILSSAGKVEFFNEAGLCRMQIDSLDEIAGQPWIELWPEDSKPTIADAIHRAGNRESVRFESFCPTAKGEPRWWDVTVSPILDKQGQLENIIAVSRDITERHEHEARLASLIDVQNTKLSQSELHLEEIHHRVKNSLQLVNTLLLLQANVAVEESVKLQLQTAANRILTIAAVHERLYQNADKDGVLAKDYLHALLLDMGAAFGDRKIELDADPFPLPEERIAPIGLVISELVVNALKYGKGTIGVSLRKEGEQAVITVTDEGSGFPESYPEPNGSGLGMRLIKSYSGYGAQGIMVDRTAKTSTIRVRFKL